MKHKVLCLLMTLALMLCLFSGTALASVTNYPYITMDDSDDFTVVKNVSGGTANASVKVVGMDSSYVKHDFTGEEDDYLTWSSDNTSVATVSPGSGNATATISVLDEGSATVTITYDTPTADPVTVTCFVVGEDTITNSVAGIDVTVDGSGDSQSNPASNFSLTNLTVYRFELDMFDPAIDDADVLKRSPSALHALLYALELNNDDDAYFYTDANWDWDWVPDHVTLDYEGSYVVEINGDEYSWEYTVNSSDPGHAASAHKLSANDEVDWDF